MKESVSVGCLTLSPFPSPCFPSPPYPSPCLPTHTSPQDQELHQLNICCTSPPVSLHSCSSQHSDKEQLAILTPLPLSLSPSLYLPPSCFPLSSPLHCDSLSPYFPLYSPLPTPLLPSLSASLPSLEGPVCFE